MVCMKFWSHWTWLPFSPRLLPEGNFTLHVSLGFKVKTKGSWCEWKSLGLWSIARSFSHFFPSVLWIPFLIPKQSLISYRAVQRSLYIYCTPKPLTRSPHFQLTHSHLPRQQRTTEEQHKRHVLPMIHALLLIWEVKLMRPLVLPWSQASLRH